VTHNNLFYEPFQEGERGKGKKGKEKRGGKERSIAVGGHSREGRKGRGNVFPTPHERKKREGGKKEKRDREKMRGRRARYFSSARKRKKNPSWGGRGGPLLFLFF